MKILELLLSNIIIKLIKFEKMLIRDFTDKEQEVVDKCNHRILEIKNY